MDVDDDTRTTPQELKASIAGQEHIRLRSPVGLVDPPHRCAPISCVYLCRRCGGTGGQYPAAVTNADNGAGLDLDAILAARWADSRAFPPGEFARAEAFWRAQRTRDQELLMVRAKATDLIRQWTGCPSRDVGSFGLRLNLQTSDLDLGIGYPVDQRDALITVLRPHTVFKGERKTRFCTTRLVFAFTVEGVEVDLSALTEEDFAVACRMLDEIESTMTEQERIAHTWVKHLLHSSGRMSEYAEWKLATYARFCPEFNWVPIPETV